jgi:hypothetical protein
MTAAEAISERRGLPVFYDTEELAAILKYQPKTLRNWRLEGKGPNFIPLGKNGRTQVLYKRSAVLLWLRDQGLIDADTVIEAEAGEDRSGLPILLDTFEVARLLHLEAKTIRNWRAEGKGPRPIRLGDAANMKALYALKEVLRWMDEDGNRGEDEDDDFTED